MRTFLMTGIVICATAAAVVRFELWPSFASAGNSGDKTYIVKSEDAAMRRAAYKASAGLDGFLKKLDNPPPGTDNYAVKVGILDDGDGYRLTGKNETAIVEYFWLTDVTRTPKGFTARISNTPEDIRHVSVDQVIAFGRADIFDWMYMENGKLKGNFSACPALMAGPREELEQFIAEYGIECN